MQEPEKLKETEGRDGSTPGQAPAMPPTGLTPTGGPEGEW